MVALNFQPRFAALIEAGKKTQTIRRPTRLFAGGDPLQLYTGQRTPGCRKLADATCLDCTRVEMDPWVFGFDVPDRFPRDADAFARLDGFDDYAEMWRWFSGHYKVSRFRGYVIRFRVDRLTRP